MRPFVAAFRSPWLPAIVLVSLPLAARAQDGLDASRPKHLSARVFNIPFSVGNEPDVRQLKLYVSANNGTTWDLHATAQAGQRGFDVRLDRDGSYSFAIQTIKSNDEAFPPRTELLRASQFVVVDTERPVITLRALSPRMTNAGKVVGVQWEVRDENLDPRSLRLEARPAGQGAWRPITDKIINPQGEDARTVDSRDRVEYRMLARDYAGNEAVQTIVVGGGANVGLTNDGTGAAAPAPGIGRSRSKYILVNKPDISLEFAVREKGPSGIAKYDLWLTRSRQDWQQLPSPSIKKSETDPDRATLTYRAAEDGLYGFSIIAQSNAGIAQPEPAKGEEPQIWVEVDTKPPEAKFIDVKFASPNDARSIIVTWSATDKNIDTAPIFLEYQVKKTDQWQELAYALPNTGRYTVQTPALGNADFQFSIRMRVIDKAGNQTAVEYEKPIVVDLIRPRVEITDAMPVK